MSIVEHNIKQHEHIQKILKHIESLYGLECDEALEEVSKMYLHLARLTNTMSRDIDNELAEVEGYVFG
jgi:hypothetical protein